MPKKMGENTKAVQARERKKQAKLVAQEKAAKDAEDKLWEDNDKILTKKKLRKEEEEKKKAEQARKKAEARSLLDQEVASIKTSAKSSNQKITRHQIEKTVEQTQKLTDSQKAAKLPAKVVEQNLPEENLNRQLSDTIFATNIDEAIAVLSVSNENEADRHPEKRLKAAFKAFEAANLSRIKEENPTLRMSQWKQILIKEWNKSSQNPLNQKP